MDSKSADKGENSKGINSDQSGGAGTRRQKKGEEWGIRVVPPPPPVICKELKRFVYAHNWIRVERLLKKGGHSISAEWKGQGIFMLSLVGFERRSKKILSDKTINERTRTSQLYCLNKDFESFAKSHCEYIRALDAKKRAKTASKKK